MAQQAAPPLHLSKKTLEWALKHVVREGDTDVFPRPFELDIIEKNQQEVIKDLRSIAINTHQWMGPRRIIVPKTELSFRPVHQLDPYDAILYAGIVRDIGSRIERRRSPAKENNVFSYRFKPTISGRLYSKNSKNSGLEDFWKKSEMRSSHSSHVLCTDISDYYNQIYHHTIENQLDLFKIDRGYWHALKNLFANVTEGVSRGIPIGPHPSHLIAELAMIPVDEFLASQNVQFCRYVDDIHVFGRSADEIHEILFKLVDFLDKSQKLQINRQKTKIYRAEAFREICKQNLVDRPINELENQNFLLAEKNTYLEDQLRVHMT